jgi:UDP-2-acetamido-3-amino-2,3-dideoxy-glucuronate N-acetyltransferase
MHKFEKLEVWQLAVEYADLCYTIAEKLPKSEEYNLASQLRRAAISIALNIAEGSTSQTDPEQARFLAMAIRSLIETVAYQHLIHRRNYLADTTLLREAYQASEKLVAKLQAMRQKVLEGPTLQEVGAEYIVDPRTPFDVTANDQQPMTNNQIVRRSSLVVGQAKDPPSSFVVGRSSKYFVHPTAVIDEPCGIGADTKTWHFCHVMRGVRIGERCILGQNVFIANDVVIGNNVKIQNNVSLYTGVELEDDVFCGPSCVFTNVSNPRSQIVRHHLYERTLVRRGATIGANATIVCGVTIGRYAFIGAGAVVTHDVPDYALMLGVPARQVGWTSRHGHRLDDPDGDGVMICPESGWRYKEVEPGVLRCLDWPEDEPLPETKER